MKFFGTDGIRGEVFKNIDHKIAFDCGNALCKLKDNPKIILGKDTRVSGDYITMSFCLGAILGGATVVDVEPLGLYTLLYNNFKKMSKVWLSRNPSSESTGIPSNQLWAIKNLPRVYTKDQLIKLFSMLTELDSKYKQGNFPMELLVDYLILKCLLV